jgi:hypothetical protein
VGRYPAPGHPAIAPLDAPGSFSAARPQFRTKMHVTPIGSGMAVLQWASDQFGVDPPGSQLTVGKLRFTLNSADSVMVALEEALGMTGTELNNVDVAASFRGHDGGRYNIINIISTIIIPRAGPPARVEGERLVIEGR